MAIWRIGFINLARQELKGHSWSQFIIAFYACCLCCYWCRSMPMLVMTEGEKTRMNVG